MANPGDIWRISETFFYYTMSRYKNQEYYAMSRDKNEDYSAMSRDKNHDYYAMSSSKSHKKNRKKSEAQVRLAVRQRQHLNLAHKRAFHR